MFPIALDLSKAKILLIGQGEAFEKRHAQLLEYGATNLIATSNQQLATGNYNLVMVAGLPRAESEKIATEARAAGKLVNVEDVNHLCDFYFTANVKRGDLLIAVSTGGASPTLARRVRDHIAKIFGAEWESRTAEIKDFRNKLKSDGKTIPEILKASDEFLHEKNWLNLDCHLERSERSLQNDRIGQVS